MTIRTEIKAQDIKGLEYLIGKAEKRLPLIKTMQDRVKCIREIKLLKTSLNALIELRELKTSKNHKSGTVSTNKKYSPEAAKALKYVLTRIIKYEAYKSSHPQRSEIEKRIKILKSVVKFIKRNKTRKIDLSEFPHIIFKTKLRYKNSKTYERMSIAN